MWRRVAAGSFRAGGEGGTGTGERDGTGGARVGPDLIRGFGRRRGTGLGVKNGRKCPI